MLHDANGYLVDLGKVGATEAPCSCEILTSFVSNRGVCIKNKLASFRLLLSRC